MEFISGLMDRGLIEGEREMSTGMLIGAILGRRGSAVKGFQNWGSSQSGHAFGFMIALVHTAAPSLTMSSMFPMLPRSRRACAKLISMVLADIYGSIPEGFS